MGIKAELEKINTIEECTQYLHKTLMACTTVYSKVYSDYENKEFSKRIKAYQKDNNSYIITISNFENMKIKELDVCLTNKKPKEPHPLFPILTSFAPEAIVYHFCD